MYVLSRITSFRHGWWFWTVAFQKPSIWQFYHYTFIKASPLSKLPRVLGPDLWEGKEKKKMFLAYCFDQIHNSFFSQITISNHSLALRKSCKCKRFFVLLSFLEADWKWSWLEPTQLLLEVLVFSAKNSVRAVRSEANWSAYLINFIHRNSLAWKCSGISMNKMDFTVLYKGFIYVLHITLAINAF